MSKAAVVNDYDVKGLLDLLGRLETARVHFTLARHHEAIAAAAPPAILQGGPKRSLLMSRGACFASACRMGVLMVCAWFALSAPAAAQLAATLYDGRRGTTIVEPPPGPGALDPLSVAAYWGYWPSPWLARQPIGHQILATSPNGYVYRPVYADDATAASIAMPGPEDMVSRARPPFQAAAPQGLVADALAQFKAGGYEAALDRANRVLDLDPDNGDALLLIVQCYFALGNYELAAEALDDALATAPEHDWEKFVANYKQYFPSSLRFARHLRSLEGFVDQNPDLPAGHLLIGYFYGSLGETKRALSELAAARPNVAAETLAEHFSTGQEAPAPGLDEDANGPPPGGNRPAPPRGRAF